MTEEKQGGTAPEPEASAPETDQAPEPVGTAVAVADEPATAESIDPTGDTRQRSGNRSSGDGRGC